MAGPHFPQIYTFYSYKGGVGRTMALLNVAYTLAGWGRHVLIMDMDLEAPGASGYLERIGELEPKPEGLLDVLSLISEVMRLTEYQKDPKKVIGNLAPISHFCRSVMAEKLEPLKPEMGGLGRIDVLGPDATRNYEDRLALLGIQGCPRDRLVEISRVLHHYLKNQTFSFLPHWLEGLEEPEPTHYDYILVDSRTGITETGGLCVGPLSEKLIVLTGLNDQNIEGTKSFLALTGICDKFPPDPPEPGGENVFGKKPTIMVASPIPTSDVEYRKRRLDLLREIIGINPLRIYYHPQLALMETIFVRDLPEEYNTEGYRRIADRMLELSDDSTAKHAARQQELLQNKGDIAPVVYALPRIAPLAPDLTATAVDRISQLLENKTNQTGTSTRIRINALVATSLRYRPLALGNIANAISDQARSISGGDADRLYLRAFEIFEEASKNLLINANNLSNWAAALSDQARTKSGEEAVRLYQLAIEKCEAATSRQPDLAQAWSNWGIALSGQANNTSGDAADRLFSLSIEKYHKATLLQPSLAECWGNWASALSDHAARRSKFGENVDHLFHLAYERFEEAIRRSTTKAEHWRNWGVALLSQARIKSGDIADEIYSIAIEKFKEATRLEPSHADAWNNWGAGLLIQINNAESERAKSLLIEARRVLTKAAELDPAKSAYNMACLEAREGNLEAALHWLTVSRDAGNLPTTQQLAEDPDLADIRPTPEFQSFLQSLKPSPTE